MKALKIDIYSDIGCPWCFIGTRRLRSVLEELDGSLAVELHHHPYLLNPDAPPEGFDLHAMLRERYGADPRPMFARAEEAARQAGIPLDLSRQPFAYDTSGAHTLLRHAAARETQTELADALFAAYFLEGRNVSDPQVLASVAAEHGFAEAEVYRLVADDAELALTRLEAADAARSGVRGVPLFILNDRYSLAGAQPPEIFRQGIARALREGSAETAA